MRCFFGPMFRAETTSRRIGDQLTKLEELTMKLVRTQGLLRYRLRHITLIATSLNQYQLEEWKR